jgi:hypothetical protein
MTRAEARRQFPPRPLIEQVEEDGATIMRPMLRDGQPVMGPDPLGHLSDADWQASGNVLRIPEQPEDEAVMAALIPKAFKVARAQVMRLLALVTVSNRDLETWDGEQDIDAKLDEKGRQLMHDCSAGELLGLATAAMQLARGEVAGPFEDARRAWGQMFAPKTEDPEPTPEPMRMEAEDDDETTPLPTSSTASEDATAGTPAPSSTASAGGS